MYADPSTWLFVLLLSSIGLGFIVAVLLYLVTFPEKLLCGNRGVRRVLGHTNLRKRHRLDGYQCLSTEGQRHRIDGCNKQFAGAQPIELFDTWRTDWDGERQSGIRGDQDRTRPGITCSNGNVTGSIYSPLLSEGESNDTLSVEGHPAESVVQTPMLSEQFNADTSNQITYRNSFDLVMVAGIIVDIAVALMMRILHDPVTRDPEAGLLMPIRDVDREGFSVART